MSDSDRFFLDLVVNFEWNWAVADLFKNNYLVAKSRILQHFRWRNGANFDASSVQKNYRVAKSRRNLILRILNSTRMNQSTNRSIMTFEFWNINGKSIIFVWWKVAWLDARMFRTNSAKFVYFLVLSSVAACGTWRCWISIFVLEFWYYGRFSTFLNSFLWRLCVEISA
jgi:hypothetical protein